MLSRDNEKGNMFNGEDLVAYIKWYSKISSWNITYLLYHFPNSAHLECLEFEMLLQSLNRTLEYSSFNKMGICLPCARINICNLTEYRLHKYECMADCWEWAKQTQVVGPKLEDMA